MTHRNGAFLAPTSTPARHLIVAPSSDPSMDEALAHARRIDQLDRAAHAAASHVRHPAMTS